MHNGSDFLKAMQKQASFNDIPVIVLSSIDNSQLNKEVKGLGANKFLTKPTRSSDLYNTIIDVICKDKVTQSKNELTSISEPAPDNASSITTKLTPSQIDILVAEDNEVNQMFAGYAIDDRRKMAVIITTSYFDGYIHARNGRLSSDKSHTRYRKK